MKTFIKKITGITAREDKLREEAKREHAVREETANRTPEETRRAALELEKVAATKAGQPWVAVLDTQINPDDIKNGFFEIDWNNEFIEQLLDAGYKGETNEAIVDAWFQTLIRQMLGEEGQSTDAQAGYINVVPIDKGKSEVS